MNKKDLIEILSQEAGLPKTQANQVIDIITRSISDALVGGGKVMLMDFGTFSVSKRSARVARNPKTNVKVKVKAKKVARFRAGKLLDDLLAGK